MTARLSRAALLHAVATLLALAALAAFPSRAGAQDARTSTVQAAARDWLAIVDRGDGGATWDAAGRQFKAALTREKWSEALAAVRAPLGAVKQRSALSTKFRKAVPGAPAGEYATVLYRTSFASRDDARETVTLEHEPDDRWRVVGYVIQ